MVQVRAPANRPQIAITQDLDLDIATRAARNKSLMRRTDRWPRQAGVTMMQYRPAVAMFNAECSGRLLNALDTGRDLLRALYHPACRDHCVVVRP